jgi:hypothetical protein
MTRLSKLNVQRLAEDIAASTTSGGRPLDPDALAKRLWRAMRRCILCDKPSYVFAVFSPGEKADPVVRTGLKPGQSRALFYGLCVKCTQIEDARERVEAKLGDAHLKEANLRAALEAAGVPYDTETGPAGERWITPDDAA